MQEWVCTVRELVSNVSCMKHTSGLGLTLWTQMCALPESQFTGTQNRSSAMRRAQTIMPTQAMLWLPSCVLNTKKHKNTWEHEPFQCPGTLRATHQHISHGINCTYHFKFLFFFFFDTISLHAFLLASISGRIQRVGVIFPAPNLEWHKLQFNLNQVGWSKKIVHRLSTLTMKLSHSLKIFFPRKDHELHFMKRSKHWWDKSVEKISCHQYTTNP